MYDVLSKMCGSDFSYEEPEMPYMYYIGNEQGQGGVAYVLYDGILAEVAERMESDLIILPSSIHEMLAIPYVPGIGMYEDSKKMVCSVNETDLEESEFLSEEVFFYERATGYFGCAKGKTN